MYQVEPLYIYFLCCVYSNIFIFLFLIYILTLPIDMKLCKRARYIREKQIYFVCKTDNTYSNLHKYK